ncbi:MAG TPA: hypothetical protein VF896_00070 [Anaerolineales bacterium]
MNKYLRYGFLENLDTVRHIPVGKFWGIKLSVTPITWLSPIVFFALGAILGIFEPRMNLIQTLYHIGVFVIGVEISTLIHALGHILGGKLVRSPMDELLLTATRGVNIYHGDQEVFSGFVHVGRAMGGPILNLLTFSVLMQLLHYNGAGFRSDVLAAIASTSLFMGAGGFLPLPSVDGQVIWREVFHWLALRWRENAQRE